MSVDGCQTPSTIPCSGRSPDSKRESASSGHEQSITEKVEPSRSERNGFEEATLKPENEEVEEEEDAAVTEDDEEREASRKSRSKKRRVDPVAFAKAEAEYKKRARGIADLVRLVAKRLYYCFISLVEVTD